MTHVHYKFSSKLSYDTVVFDGPHITLRDLKRQIMGREKLRAGDCDLQITNAQSKQEYTDDDGLIHKGSSVIVRRIPVSGGKSGSSSKTNHTESSGVQFQHFGTIKAMDDHSSSRGFPFFAQMANLAEADVPEEEKLEVVLKQSTYDSMNYKKFGTVLPANYTCHRCGNTGHHIRNCPTSGQDKNFEPPLRIKKSTGIPRSFMVEVDDPSIKGAMLTNCGRYAIPAIDAEAYAIGKKEKPPFVPQENPKLEVEADPVPDELLCVICQDLLSDAVVIPCCGNSYCDDCIRNTLLDSDDHICPSCSQSDVSPDTLIANKFLRQAVNNFKKERGYSKSIQSRCGASQNPAMRPSPVPTPPPVTGQGQPQRPHQQACTQQDSPQCHPKGADTLPLPNVDPTSAYSRPSTSSQPEQSLEITNKEAEEKTQDDLAAAAPAPSVVVSNKESTAAPSQQIPVVNQTVAAEQPQIVSRNQEQSSSSLGSTPSLCGPPPCRESSSSSSGIPTRGWTESQQRISTSTSYSTSIPPLFPAPLFLSAHQSHCSYPPGYQPATPIWTVPSPQGMPIPSLCSSTSTSSIPSLIPDEWYRHQRKRKESSPHRGSTYRRSSSSSNSKSSKSKSSRSYSRSSSRSRSRSRSRSQGRSRHLSPYSHHRDLCSRSHPTSSYSYGYKRSRSPTPSSSSSPRVGHYSRSKSPSDHQKKRHHSRHQNKKSGSYNSRRRGERSDREVEASEVGLGSYLYTQHGNQTTSLDLDRERYLQWKREYKDWCEKYFSNYVSQFHQLPLPIMNLPPPPPPLPPPPPQWVDGEGSKTHSHTNSDSHCQPQCRRSAQTDGHSSSSQSSSDCRSPPSQSSSDSHCAPSQSFSDSRSSPSHTSNDGRSPRSQSSSNGRSMPSDGRAKGTNAYQQKYKHLPITIRKSITQVELHKRSNDNMKNVEDISSLKHDQKRRKKHKEGKGEESSSSDVPHATDERRRDNGPNACKDGALQQDEATTSNTFKPVQHSLKPNKSLDKHSERESREQKKLKREKDWIRGKHSDSRREVERPHKVKPSKEADTVDSDRYGNPGGSEAADTRSEKNTKRKGEELERNETQCTSESPNPFDRKKQKNEKKKEIKTQPLTEKDIWEEGIKVKPQKKISININLDGKRKEAKSEKQELSCSENTAGKIKEENEKAGNGEDKLNRDPEDLVQNKEFTEEKIETCGVEGSELWENATFRDDKAVGVVEDIGANKEAREEEDFDLWHYALKRVVEEKTDNETLWEEGEGKGVIKVEEVTGNKSRSITGKQQGEATIRNESQGQEMAELDQNSQKGGADVRGTCNKNREIPAEVLKRRGREEERMEEAKRSTKKEEDRMRTNEPTGRHKSHNIRPNTVVDGSSCEDRQQRRTVVKPLEQHRQDKATEKDELVRTQVPLSQWKEESKQQDKAEITTQDAPLYLPPMLAVPTNQETEGENERNRQRSMDMERDRDTAEQRGRDAKIQKGFSLSSSNRPVAPSSGTYRSGSTSCTDKEKERRMQLEKDRVRGSDRQKDGKRSKEKRREEERGGYQGSKREYSNTVQHQKRNHPPSSHFSSSSVAHDLPDINANKTRRDIKHPHDRLTHRDPSQNYGHRDGTAENHRPPSSLSYSQCKDTDTLPSKFVSLTPRWRSPSWGLMQNRSRNESNDEADAFSDETKWEEKRELEEGERPPSRSSSSSSSSASLENSKDEWRKKKQKKHKKEKGQAALELLEDRDLKKHKKARRSKERREEEGGGQVDAGEKEGR